MCELLALSSAHPARLTISLRTLAAHGAVDAPSPDGWGVAFYEGPDVALFREAAPAGDSALVRWLAHGGPATTLSLAHIRRATQGPVVLANTQPFVRELGGRTHAFAHNGNLPALLGRAADASARFRPLGQTDSEAAFCDLLERLADLWRGAVPPPLAARLAIVRRFAAELRPLGPANFLYSDGEYLFAHGDRRIQRASGRIEPPGLWMLRRHCRSGDPVPDCPALRLDGPSEQTVLLLASVPLTDEPWQPLAPGEVVVVRAGQTVAPDGAIAAVRETTP